MALHNHLEESPQKEICDLQRLVKQLVDHHTSEHGSCSHLNSFLPTVSPSPSQCAALVPDNESSAQCIGVKRKQLEFHHYRGDCAPGPTIHPNAPAWISTANKLIEQTPKAVQWMRIIEENNIRTLLQKGVGAQFLLDVRTMPPSIPISKALLLAPTEITGRFPVLDLVTKYAEAAATRALSSQSLHMLVNFQQFLVLCMCAVLDNMKYPKEALVRITSICFNVKTEKYAFRLWRTAVFLCELFDGLGFRGWANRASELFLICRTASDMSY